MLQKLTERLSLAHYKLGCFLDDFCFSLNGGSAESVAQARLLLGDLLSELETICALSARRFSYEDIYWMPPTFVDRLNSSSLTDYRLLLAEAVSGWHAFHAPARGYPLCPLLSLDSLDFEDLEDLVEGVDF